MRQLRIEHILYALIFLVALGVRFLHLGAKPLSDYEAGWALQALHLGEEEFRIAGSPIGYVTITGALFGLFGSNTALARFWPALAGGLLVLFPVLTKAWLGRRAALFLALGLALDPGLVAVSRIAAGAMPAVSLTFLALGLLMNRRALGAGICAGLALLHGSPAIHGLFVMTLSLLAGAGLQWIRPASSEDSNSDRIPLSLPASGSRLFWISAAGIFLLVGSGYGWNPQGLGAWASALPTYLAGWLELPGVPAMRLVAALAIYQSLVLIFSLVGLVQSWIGGNGFARLLALNLVFAFILTLVYPARLVMDLAWVIVPLWAMAAMILAGSLTIELEHKPIMLGQAGLIFILTALLWLNLAGMAQPVVVPQTYSLRLTVTLGVIGLVAVTTALVGLGWSWRVAWNGLVAGLTTVFLLYTAGNIWEVSQWNKDFHPDFWSPAPISENADILLGTIRDLSSWTTNRPDGIDVVLAVDAPSLEWLLRGYPKLEKVASLQDLLVEESPSIVIARESENQPSLASDYRGHAFSWWQKPAWSGALPVDTMRWIVFRQTSELSQEQIILWARTDLFPGGGDYLPDVPEQPTGVEDQGETNPY